MPIDSICHCRFQGYRPLSVEFHVIRMITDRGKIRRDGFVLHAQSFAFSDESAQFAFASTPCINDPS